MNLLLQFCIKFQLQLNREISHSCQFFQCKTKKDSYKHYRTNTNILVQWQRLGLTCFRLTKRSKKIQLAVFLNPLLFPASSEKGYLPLVCQATTPPHAVIWGKKKHAQV